MQPCKTKKVQRVHSDIEWLLFHVTCVTINLTSIPEKSRENAKGRNQNMALNKIFIEKDEEGGAP